MLKITPNPTFEAKVGISVAGQVAKETITLIFKHQNRESAKEWVRRCQQAGGNLKEEAMILAEVIDDWSGVDVPFTSESLIQLMSNYQAAGMEIFNAYMAELSGAKQGN